MDIHTLHAFGKHAVSAEWLNKRMLKPGDSPAVSESIRSINATHERRRKLHGPGHKNTNDDVRRAVGQLRTIRKGKAKIKETRAGMLADVERFNTARKHEAAAKAKIKAQFESAPTPKAPKTTKVPKTPISEALTDIGRRGGAEVRQLTNRVGASVSKPPRNYGRAAKVLAVAGLAAGATYAGARKVLDGK